MLSDRLTWRWFVWFLRWPFDVVINRKMAFSDYEHDGGFWRRIFCLCGEEVHINLWVLSHPEVALDVSNCHWCHRSFLSVLIPSFWDRVRVRFWNETIVYIFFATLLATVLLSGWGCFAYGGYLFSLLGGISAWVVGG